jgi:hypothetical protein
MTKNIYGSLALICPIRRTSKISLFFSGRVRIDGYNLKTREEFAQVIPSLNEEMTPMSYRSKLQVKFLCITVAAEGAFAVCASVTIILAVLLFSRF